MNGMSVDQWDNEYARLARSASQMRTTGILKSAADVRSLNADLQSLEANLPKNLSVSELSRRKRLIQHLQNTTTTSSSSAGGGQQGQQQQQASQMSTAMDQQDAMIDQLASGVSRLKHQSMAIGEEANLHVNLMETMETGLDQAAVGLLEETRRAAALREDQSVWRLQLIVAGLSVLLVLLIFMGLSP